MLMMTLTRIIDLLVRFVTALGGRIGRVPQFAAWTVVVVVAVAGVSLVAVGIAYIDDLVHVLRGDAASAAGGGALTR
ncbi:hypothetical protein B9C99_16535 [Rhodococcus sp. BUPNP1]|nr:hypothetical protein B9C99_16535 [Rhodococcus sp. BUPNP1]